jgi:hypothetical protein
VVTGLVSFGLDPFEIDPELLPMLLRGTRAKLICGGSPPCWNYAHVADPRYAFSMRQHNLTPLDLIAAETSRDLAMWTNDGRIAGDRNPQVRIVTLIDGFLKCNKPSAR